MPKVTFIVFDQPDHLGHVIQHLINGITILSILKQGKKYDVTGSKVALVVIMVILADNTISVFIPENVVLGCQFDNA